MRDNHADYLDEGIRNALKEGSDGIRKLRHQVENIRTDILGGFDEIDLADDVRANLIEVANGELGVIQGMLASMFERSEMLDELSQ